ncbi:MAG TPA: 50S ribosomal protein L18 [Syntrophales bacterium]|nr:50S ribosomal protein L18 [Syntrophales bacterium]
MKNKVEARERRHRRVRKNISGTAQRPRLSVFRSNKHIYAQLIDDTTGKTLTTTSSLDQEYRQQNKKGSNSQAAATIGAALAKRAVSLNIKEVVFDRNGYLYHGRIKALADAARQAGLIF